MNMKNTEFVVINIYYNVAIVYSTINLIQKKFMKQIFKYYSRKVNTKKYVVFVSALLQSAFTPLHVHVYSNTMYIITRITQYIVYYVCTCTRVNVDVCTCTMYMYVVTSLHLISQYYACTCTCIQYYNSVLILTSSESSSTGRVLKQKINSQYYTTCKYIEYHKQYSVDMT